MTPVSPPISTLITLSNEQESRQFKTNIIHCVRFDSQAQAARIYFELFEKTLITPMIFADSDSFNNNLMHVSNQLSPQRHWHRLPCQTWININYVKGLLLKNTAEKKELQILFSTHTYSCNIPNPFVERAFEELASLFTQFHVQLTAESETQKLIFSQKSTLTISTNSSEKSVKIRLLFHEEELVFSSLVSPDFLKNKDWALIERGPATHFFNKTKIQGFWVENEPHEKLVIQFPKMTLNLFNQALPNSPTLYQCLSEQFNTSLENNAFNLRNVGRELLRAVATTFAQRHLHVHHHDHHHPQRSFIERLRKPLGKHKVKRPSPPIKGRNQIHNLKVDIDFTPFLSAKPTK